MTRFDRPVLLTLLFILSTPALAVAPAQRPDVDPLRLPCGVASEDGKTGFLLNRRGGIDALDLATGTLLWSTTEPAKPLLVSGKRLIVQVADENKPNVLRVAVLDLPAKGKRLLLSDSIVFPDWVAVGLAYGRSFASSGRIEEGKLLLKWQASAFYDGGAIPSQQTERKARREAAGVARVHLETGRVRLLEAEEPGVGLTKVRRELKRERATPYWNGRAWTVDPLLVGDTLVRPLLEGAEEGQVAVKLRRWDANTGKLLLSVSLLRGKWLRPVVSLDGRHLLVCVFPDKGVRLSPEDRAIRVFSLKTGESVGTLPEVANPLAVAILPPRAYLTESRPMKMRPRGVMEQPTRLKALSLKTGKVAWEHPVIPRRALVPLP